MTAIDVIEAMRRAGVDFDPVTLDEIVRGDFLLAFADAITLADQQEIVLDAELTKDIRGLFDALRLKPSFRSVVEPSLCRVEERAAMHAA